jgi:hypothetical protein
MEKRLLLGQAFMSAAQIASAARLFAQTQLYASHAKKIGKENGDLETVHSANTLLAFSKAFTGGREVIQHWLDEEYAVALKHVRQHPKALLMISWGSFYFLAAAHYPEEAKRRWEEGMEMLRRSGNLWIQGTGLQIAADLKGRLGETAEAQHLAGQILSIYTELGDTYAANPARTLLADLARKEGDLEKAAQLYREAILVWRDSDRADAGVRILETLGYIAHAKARDANHVEQQGYLVHAATILGATAGIRRTISRPVGFVDKAEYDNEVVALREELGARVFQAAWDKGEKLNLDQVVRLATEESPLFVKD